MIYKVSSNKDLSVSDCLHWEHFSCKHVVAFATIFLCNFSKKIMRYISKNVRLTLHLQNSNISPQGKYSICRASLH